MQPFLLPLFSLAWLVSAIGHSEGGEFPFQPKVLLHGGSVVSGIIDHDYPAVSQFLGIPYAQPPIGELRWEVPPANHLPRFVNATALGKSCTQFYSTPPNIFNEDLPEYDIADVNSTREDCLTLSIWTPRRAHNLPVIIFFYGGGWYAGGQDTPYSIPTQWVQRTNDLVLIVPNFRGNIFGFPKSRGVRNQNLGLLDQRTVVEWVRDNIDVFGGNPQKITIWGQSSGAEAVDIYNYAWYKDPIVKGLIMDSGTALIEPVLEPASGPRYSNFTYVADHVGRGNTGNASEELECMKKIDARTIENVLAKNSNDGVAPFLSFGPAPDEKTVFTNYTERSLQGQVTNLVSGAPAVIGLNKEDAVAFAPYNASGPDLTISDYWFLVLFLCPTYQTSKLRAGAGFPTYRYLYAGNFTNLAPRPWTGAYHGSELPMLFGTHDNYRGASTKYEIAVSEAMQDTWRAFANDPHRGLAGQQWDGFTPNRDAVRWFGDGE